MATLSLRIRDTLKRKAENLANREGVSLNNFINAMLAAVVAQEEALAFFEDRLRTVDLEALHRRVMAFMGKAQRGREPTREELEEAIHGR
jgi:antitoxin component of RelBE/YafQ-DinJ toxin-antitoxin module